MLLISTIWVSIHFDWVFLAKNEDEYLNNLFELEQPNPLSKSVLPTKGFIDPRCLRKINVLTSRDRPFCAFCSALCGFSWHLKTVPHSEEEEDQPMTEEQVEA